MTVFDTLISSHNRRSDICMRKDINIEKNCCWEAIDRRLNPDKYKKEKIY